MADNDLAKNEVTEKKHDTKPDNESRGLGGWFAGIRGEFKKIIWPNRKELTEHTITVIITSAIIAACVFIMDFGFGSVYNAILDFAQNFRS